MSHNRRLNVGYAACILLSIMVIVTLMSLWLVGDIRAYTVIGLCVAIILVSVFCLARMR